MPFTVACIIGFWFVHAAELLSGTPPAVRKLSEECANRQLLFTRNWYAGIGCTAKIGDEV